MPTPSDVVNDRGKLRPTKKQLAFAETLEIQVPADVTRETLSQMIDVALSERNEKETEELYALRDEADAAVARAREELLEELVDDPQVSNASREQMCKALAERGLASIIITVPYEQLDDMIESGTFHGNLAFGDDLDIDLVKDTLVRVTARVLDMAKESEAENVSSAVIDEKITALISRCLSALQEHDENIFKSSGLSENVLSHNEILLGFEIHGVCGHPIGVLMPLPPKKVSADFDAFISLTVCDRPTSRTTLQQVHQKPQNKHTRLQRVLVRVFDDGDTLIWPLDE